jgi:hypothetical protein
VITGLGLGFAGYAQHLNEVAFHAEMSFPADDAEEFCPLDIVDGFWLDIAAEPCPLADVPACVE